jgi:hypothetical protein
MFIIIQKASYLASVYVREFLVNHVRTTISFTIPHIQYNFLTAKLAIDKVSLATHKNPEISEHLTMAGAGLKPLFKFSFYTRRYFPIWPCEDVALW